MSSSTTSALSRQPLREVLQGVADPRDRRGVRHDLPTILCLAVTGILAGCRSLMAIWEHATDLEPDDLEALGLEAGRALPSPVHHPTGPLGPGACYVSRLSQWSMAAMRVVVRYRTASLSYLVARPRLCPRRLKPRSTALRSL